MANYPTSLDTFTNPTSVDSLSAPSHSDQHANANDAIEAIEAKLGIGASTAGSATEGYVLTAGTGGTTTWASNVINVQSAVKSDAFSTSSTSFTDVTGLSVSITPSSATSKVLVIVNLFGGKDALGDLLFNLNRGATALAQPTGATYNQTFYVRPQDNSDIRTASFAYFDSPATTSATTYKIQMKVLTGTGYINRRGSDTAFYVSSTITAMEIKQ